MDNYYISRFEDIISKPEENIRKLCNFLEIEFKDNMMYPSVADSSYGKPVNKKGFDKNTLLRWKKNITPQYEALIKLLLKHEMKELGYI